MTQRKRGKKCHDNVLKKDSDKSNEGGSAKRKKGTWDI